MSVRKAILVINATRPEAVQAATTLAALLSKSSFELFTSSAVKISGVETVKTEELPEAEIVLSFSVEMEQFFVVLKSPAYARFHFSGLI